MKLIAAKLRDPNFGDDLNEWMWPRLLPGVFDDEPSVVFLGIGSILNHRFNGPAAKVVAGAGHAAAYGDPPDLGAGDWRFYFVRGPRTAAAVGLDRGLAMGDAAILVRTLIDPARRRPGSAAFMPHWESMGWGFWGEACEAAGLTLIDPRRPVEEVLSLILESRVVVAESLHGAVVADALRVPWTPMRPIDPRHRAKWRDWAESLEIELRPRPLAPSSLAELVPLLTRRVSIAAAARTMMQAWPLTPVRRATVGAAAGALRAAAQAAPQMSPDRAIAIATERMLEQVDRLRRDALRGRFEPRPPS